MKNLDKESDSTIISLMYNHHAMIEKLKKELEQLKNELERREQSKPTRIL